MARYWYNCSDCDKRIKKQLGFSGEPLCSKCITNRRKRNCIVCDNVFNPHTTIGERGKKNIFCSVSCSSKFNLKGRKLSKEHKENLSKNSFNRGGYKNIKFYKIYCPHKDKEISVQGTWELKYAKMLNESNIKWERNKGINLSYKKDDDIIRTYYPDFYLIESDTYIEIKGYYPDIDKEKMKLVKEQNPNDTIEILMKEDLIKLNILI